MAAHALQVLARANSHQLVALLMLLTALLHCMLCHQAIVWCNSSWVMQGVKCVPASDVSASEAAFQGVTVTSLTDHPQVTSLH